MGKLKNEIVVFRTLFPLCLSLIVLIIISCSNINDPIELDKENLVAFSAIFNTDSGYTGRIVIVDYNNPTNYKIVTPSGLKAVGPVFSYTKEKILFGLDGIMAHGYQFAVYDINTGEMEKLYANDVVDGAPLAGTNPVWDFEDRGFYFTQYHTYSIAMGIYYYDLTTKEVTGLYTPQDASVYVVGLKSIDTLIVFSNKYILALNDSTCYFFMSKSGEYFSSLKNQHLGHNTNWNYENKQFAYSGIINNSIFAIFVTDIEETFRKQYTNSHYDTRPVWGPDNSIIFFNRQADSNQLVQLYYVNIVTGDVRQFINPAIISGADYILDAAY